MENHHFHENKVLLSIKISCCEQCPRRLEKTILKMHGVNSTWLDMQNDVVQVRGTIDPMTLLNKVSKLGKRVQLLPSDWSPTRYDNKQKGEAGARCHEAPRSGLDHQAAKPEERKEEPHKCEPYEAPTISEKVCRDYFCKVHPRGRSIVDKVSSKDGSPFLFGGLPFGGSGGFGHHMNPMWHGVEPPMYGYQQQQQPYPHFGFQHPPRMLPPRRPFSFE